MRKFRLRKKWPTAPAGSLKPNKRRKKIVLIYRYATRAHWLLRERPSRVAGFHSGAWALQRGERGGNLVVGCTGNRTSALTTAGDE